MKRIGFRALLLMGLLLPAAITITSGQETKKEEDYAIRIAVEEVRIDVVVLDKKGHQITDLKAKDFDVYQDGYKKDLISCKYISDQPAPAPTTPKSTMPPRDAKKIQPIPTGKLAREDVRRVIVFIVDDLSMDFENMHFARMGLKKFVENQMQSGDLIAVLRTSYGNSALQMFLSDKQQLLAKIDAMVWGPNAGRALPEDQLHPVFDGQITAMRYGIRALKDMPGRKALIVMTAQPELGGTTENSQTAYIYEGLYLKQYNDLADDALRAGVVIHLLDIRGTEAPNPEYATSSPISMYGATSVVSAENPTMPGMQGAAGMQGAGGMQRGVPGDMTARGSQPGSAAGNTTPDRQRVEALNQRDIARITSNPINAPLFGRAGRGRGFYNPARAERRLISVPGKTGGLFIENKNFFLNGIGDVNDALKGYYLLSYAPDSDTFGNNKRSTYHPIIVETTRHGATVHTRDGFYGLTKPEEESTQVPNALRDAIFSPFDNSELKINLASGYIHDNKLGYLVRSWLHLDAKDLQIQKKETGNTISLKAVCLTSDVKGYINDPSIMKYEFAVKDENLEWVKENGIRFSLLFPVKNPGSYYVRVAVQDEASNKVGSAYEFVTIPDLKKGRLAMSNMFIINSDEDASWVLSGKVKETTIKVLVPSLQKDENRTPAVKVYRPGDSIEYMTLVYNAGSPGKAPDLESQIYLYKNGRELIKGEPQKVDLNGLTEFNKIPIRRKLVLGDDMQEGNYVLQLLVRDLNKSNLVAQTLNFTVAGK
jgi:VWFA-related protein